MSAVAVSSHSVVISAAAAATAVASPVISGIGTSVGGGETDFVPSVELRFPSVTARSSVSVSTTLSTTVHRPVLVSAAPDGSDVT